MRYPMPHHPCHFEIPDDWLAEAGFAGFAPAAPAYRSSPSAELVLLTAIEPPARSLAVPKDAHGFDRARLVRVLRGFVAGDEIEAVPLLWLEETRGHPPIYGFRTRGGYHRFYAAIAAGFTHLPGDVV